MARRIICPQCEYNGLPALKRRGSNKMEWIGWLLLFPLGIPYTIWRMFGKTPACKSCGNEVLILEDSIVGQRMLGIMYGVSAPVVAKEKPQPVEPIAAPVEKPTASRPEKDPEQF